jgi:hypothetical protein
LVATDSDLQCLRIVKVTLVSEIPPWRP